MNATPGQEPVKSILPKWVRGPQDFIGGIALMGIALFALWASSDLRGMRGFFVRGRHSAPDVRNFCCSALGAAVTARRRFDRRRSPFRNTTGAGPFFVSIVDPGVRVYDPVRWE